MVGSKLALDERPDSRNCVPRDKKPHSPSVIRFVRRRSLNDIWSEAEFASVKTATKMRFARWLYLVISTTRGLFGAGDRAQVVRGGLRWDLDLSEGIDLAIFALRGFGRSTGRALKEFVRPGATVLDIGSNIGAYALQLGRLVGPEGKVYAFEPTAYAFGKLRRNLDLNPEIAGRVVAEQIQLVKNGNDSLACEIYSSWKVTGNQARHPKHLGIAQPSTGAKLLTLDRYCEVSRIKHIDFIKLDVDGFESAVIAGGLEVLKRYQPIICLELAPYALLERGSSFAELLGLLQECGYKLIRFENRSRLSDRLADLTIQIPDGAGIDVLAVPDIVHVANR